jgi:transketolase
VDKDFLEALARQMRHNILTSTTKAGSGHPSSSLSAVELTCALFFGGIFRFDMGNPANPNNDRLIFSKGHASPLFYSLWLAAGGISQEALGKMRTFGSPLEGHPVATTPFAEAATGSLGQGLSIGVGMAINAKYLDKLPYRTYVLLGDSEMAEGSQWEAMQLASHYRLENLVAILDVNRLGQRGETMYGHDVEAYARRVGAFGWDTILVPGHDLAAILQAYDKAQRAERPVMIIAKTLKGKGVSLMEDKNGWHGKPLNQQELEVALAELGEADLGLRGGLAKPQDLAPHLDKASPAPRPGYPLGQAVATRKAYGNALARLVPAYPEMVVLDAEVSNSTYAESVRKLWPERFLEMYIAEQNMVGAALGLSRRGKKPCVSTFAAFFSRAYDQIRMGRYCDANVLFCGSHAGVSIGEDGPSQMGLEDLAMFRAILDSVVLYPCDAVSTEKLVEAAITHRGISYLRTTRGETPVIYGAGEEFPIGGSKVLRKSPKDAATIVAAGITVPEALAAHDILAEQGISVRVVDCYSVKPLDEAVLRAAAKETPLVITVEDHYAQGGLGEAVAGVLAGLPARLKMLSVRAMPKSGKPAQLLDYEGISRTGIVEAVKSSIM